MLQQLELIKEIRNDVQNSREEVIFQHRKFMEELALKKREQNTESLIATVLVNNLYKEGISLFNEAKSIVCTNESTFVEKAELLDNSQKLIGVASEVVEFLISEEMPTRFFKKNRGGLLDITGLLKLMNQGKFNAVDSIIKQFIPYIDVDKEVLDNVFGVFESMNLRQIKSFEDLYSLISKLAEEQEEDECSCELQEKEYDESIYLLQEKEPEEDFRGFDLDEEHENLEENIKKIRKMHDKNNYDDTDIFGFNFSEDLDDPLLNPEYLKDSEFAI